MMMMMMISMAMTTLRVQVWVEAGAGMDVDVCQEVTYLITMMLLPKQPRTFPHDMQQQGQWAAHLSRGIDIPAARYTSTPSRKFIKGKRYQNRKPTGKKEIISTGEGKEGGGGAEGRPSSTKCCVRFPIYSCYFQRFAGLNQVTSVGFQRVAKTVHFTDFRSNTLQTPCVCNMQMIISRCCEYRPLAGLSFRKSQKQHPIYRHKFQMLRMPCGLPVIAAKYCKDYAMH